MARKYRFSPYQDDGTKKGDVANVSKLECGVHVGTHIDAPWHFLEKGHTAEAVPLDNLIGPAVVAHLPDVTAITAKDLNALQLTSSTIRLLLRTRNSKLWQYGIREFQEDFVALTADAAQWVVDRGLRLIGIDYLSIQRFEDPPTTHEILLRANTVILEGLDLTRVEPGKYELMCLPLKLVGADGAPARAVLRPLIS